MKKSKLLGSKTSKFISVEKRKNHLRKRFFTFSYMFCPVIECLFFSAASDLDYIHLFPRTTKMFQAFRGKPKPNRKSTFFNVFTIIKSNNKDILKYFDLPTNELN